MAFNEHNTFFLWVWRFNAVVIALAALLIVAGTCYTVLMQSTRQPTPVNTVELKNQPQQAEFRFGHPNSADATDYLTLPLYQNEISASVSYMSKGHSNAVNYLIINMQTNAITWLRPKNDQLFLSDYSLTISERTIARIYTLVEKDTDGDGRLTSSDRITIAASLPDGSAYQTLIENAGQVHSIQQAGDDRMVILYQKDRTFFSDIFAIPDMTLISHQPAPDIAVGQN